MIAWLGSILLAICAIPLAIQALKTRKDESNFWFLVTWTLGELLLLGVVVARQDWALALNYSVNSVCLGIVWGVRLWK
jgi:hypothetical protein